MANRVNLTEERIRTLQPPAKGEVVLWDADVGGFGVRCWPSGKKNYFLFYRAGSGREAPQRRLYLGECGSLRLADARTAARRYLGQIAAGGDPQAERKEIRQREAARLDVAIDAYEKHLTGRGVVNAKTIVATLRRELLKPLGKVDAQTITRQTIVDRVAKLETQKKPGAAQDLRAKATTFLNWMVNAGLLSSNPLAGWRRDRRTRAQRTAQTGRRLEPDEIKAIWRGCSNVAAPYGDYVRVLLLLGQRRKETAFMRRADVDLGAGVWTIPETSTKNGRVHRVPLPPLALAIIKRQPKFAGSPYVFAGAGGAAMTGWSKRHPKLVEACGVAFTLHDCRRTFRSGLTALHVDRDLAELMINHVGEELIETYDREPRWRERLQAAALWETYVETVIAEGGAVRELTAKAM
ncbi:integrase [Rhodopseudomonas thermotolerans]|uniref:Integrase n=2 Tax=Rhodopseudomonas TaxID=1073 RepID=A0A336JM65_9BRAD|nr:MULTISPECIES: site-specific integrase [Rhodopseudomonas]RED36215.1 integrase [Rhodopseudomonas pentothenatexigens]REG03588.1 integrase [Rhodopseudomonas thermotolerans]SSW90775.1 integrase [Rhodopseudomonas pentothenatexigens]